MAWFNSKEKLDPKLEGKSQDDILKLMQEAEDSKAETARLKAEREAERETVNSLNNNFNSVKQKLDQLEANSQPKPKVENEEPTNFIDDPDGAFNQRAKPLAQLTVQTAAATAKMLAQQGLDNEDMDKQTHNGRLFRQWGSEIQTLANQYQAVALTNPQTWIDIYLKVKGLHADELSDPEKRKKNYSFMESATSSVGRVEEKQKTGIESLSEQEIKVATRMGVTPENYLKRKQSMKFVGA